MEKVKRSKLVKKCLIATIVICICFVGGFSTWTSTAYEPTVSAMADMKSDSVITVEEDELIIFTPTEVIPTKGFIFYPGGLVEPQAYSTLCRDIANEGYLVVIAPMPLNLAVLSPDKADTILERFNNIDTWAIGGHSLGGVMASSYAAKNSKIKGVALYASYPQGDVLKNTDKKVVSIYGSNDGVADLNKINNAELPKDAKLIEIKGGNHGQFGSYGEQKGDNKATISEDEQISETVKYTVELLEGL